MQAVRAGLIRVVQVLRGRLTIEQGCVREGFIVSRVGDVHGSMLVVRIAGRGGGRGVVPSKFGFVPLEPCTKSPAVRSTHISHVL